MTVPRSMQWPLEAIIIALDTMQRCGFWLRVEFDFEGDGLTIMSWVPLELVALRRAYEASLRTQMNGNPALQAS